MVYPIIEYQGPAYPDWQEVDGHLSVPVNDSKTGDAFELPVGSGERALDVSTHPFAYAA